MSQAKLSLERAREIVPGVALCFALGLVSMWLANSVFFKETLHVGALLLVILLGMAWRSLVPIHDSLLAGISFSQKPVLRLAVGGLGFKLSISELERIGIPTLIAIIVCTCLALWTGNMVSKWLGIDGKLGTLLSYGTSICGASAIVAADTVVQSERSETACALGTITLLGTLGIILYPVLGRAIGMDDFAFAVWNGASLHEMAQVVAAGQTFSPDAEKWSAVVKLARITLLAPMVLVLAYQWRRKSGAVVHAKVPLVPWFLVLFVVLVGVRSFVPLDPNTIDLVNNQIVLVLLCAGMAGVGLNSGFQDIRAHGFRPMLSGTLQWVVLSGTSLAAALLLPKLR